MSNQPVSAYDYAEFDDAVLKYLGNEPETMLRTQEELADAYVDFAHKLSKIGVRIGVNFDVRIGISPIEADTIDGEVEDPT